MANPVVSRLIDVQNLHSYVKLYDRIFIYIDFIDEVYTYAYDFI